MDYISAVEAGIKLGITAKTVSDHCRNNKYDGAKKEGGKWLIPALVLDDKTTERSFSFIDLFCGIGGFHQAMKALGGTCVFACDINKQCREVYQNNFCTHNEFPLLGDITEAIKEQCIPPFDVLCAGFPCQTFSKAGLQNGFNVVENVKGERDERGQLFYRIVDILKGHPECKYIVLENVRNLADKKENWNVICQELKTLGFLINEDPLIVSPHSYGVPQVRERVLILGVRDRFARNQSIKKLGKISNELLHREEYKDELGRQSNCLSLILDKEVDDKYIIPLELEQLLDIWEQFRKNVKGLSSPFWLHKAGIGIYDRESYYNDDSIGYKKMPEWKKVMVMRSRVVYENNYDFIDRWIHENDMLSRNLIHQKFEWNASTDLKSMKDGIIQIRQSGVRVKRPNCFPSLVAMTNTPIVWDKGKSHYRYITPREAARLQSFDEDYKFSDVDSVSYKQLGNAVNVKLIRIFARELFNLGSE